MLVVAVLVTTGDVILRKLAGISFDGNVDITQLMVMTAAFAAIPYAFVTGGHVAVPLLAERLPPRAQTVLLLMAALLSCAFMSAIAWFGYFKAMEEWGYGDRTLTLGLPKIWFWLPLLLGSGLSAVYTALAAVRHGLALFSRGGSAAAGSWWGGRR